MNEGLLKIDIIIIIKGPQKLLDIPIWQLSHLCLSIVNTKQSYHTNSIRHTYIITNTLTHLSAQADSYQWTAQHRVDIEFSSPLEEEKKIIHLHHTHTIT